MIGSGINLVMTVIGFAVSSTFIVFVCTRLVCARIRLNASRRRSFRIASRSDLSILERGLHGLEPVVVANFPTKKYSEEHFLASEDVQCTVCLSEYHAEDILRILPYCSHSFHIGCIDIWLQQHSTCPVCRMSLHEFPDKKHTMRPLFSSAVRSEYGTGSFDLHSYNHVLNGQGRPSRSHENCGMEPIHVNHCPPEVDEAERRDDLFSLAGGNQIMKDPEHKQVESPSNP